MSIVLPAQDELGFCNIYLSALGGDGANMAGKLLFKLGCRDLGFDGGYDARYGSEKKGTATDVTVRFCRVGTPIRQVGPTRRPHFLVVFRDDLIAPLDLGRGLCPGAIVIVNTTRRPEEVRKDLHLHSGSIVCLDATRIAFECQSRLNMPLMAVLIQELKFPDQQLRDVVAAQWPRAREANLSALTAALKEAVAQDFADEGEFQLSQPQESRGPIGWRNMHNGGTVDALTHSTKGRDNRIAGRGHLPKFVSGACNSCGICLTVCSDPGGLIWKDGRMQGIDEAFCKGCMRCVEVCPETKKGKALTVA